MRVRGNNARLVATDMWRLESMSGLDLLTEAKWIRCMCLCVQVVQPRRGVSYAEDEDGGGGEDKGLAIEVLAP